MIIATAASAVAAARARDRAAEPVKPAEPAQPAMKGYDQLEIEIKLITSKNRITGANPGRTFFRDDHLVPISSGSAEFTVPSSVSGRYGPMPVTVRLDGNRVTFSGRMKSGGTVRRSFSGSASFENDTAVMSIKVTETEYVKIFVRGL